MAVAGMDVARHRTPTQVQVTFGHHPHQLELFPRHVSHSRQLQCHPKFRPTVTSCYQAHADYRLYLELRLESHHPSGKEKLIYFCTNLRR